MLQTLPRGVWIVAGGLVAALLAIIVARRARHPQAGDVGPISEQWMAEHKRNRDEGW